MLPHLATDRQVMNPMRSSLHQSTAPHHRISIEIPSRVPQPKFTGFRTIASTFFYRLRMLCLNSGVQIHIYAHAYAYVVAQFPIYAWCFMFVVVTCVIDFLIANCITYDVKHVFICSLFTNTYFKLNQRCHYVVPYFYLVKE